MGVEVVVEVWRGSLPLLCLCSCGVFGVMQIFPFLRRVTQAGRQTPSRRLHGIENQKLVLQSLMDR